MKRFVFALALLLSAGALFATTIEAYRFEDPEKEARYKALIEELRCLVCQNQNLADSNAELAQDMRRVTYEMVRSGKSDQEIVNFMVQRYGDFVLYRPPLRNSTVLLWVGPFLILGGGFAVLILFMRRRNREATVELSGADHERAKRLLEGDDEEAGS